MTNTPCEPRAHRALFPTVLLICCFLGLSIAASADPVPSDFDGDGKTDFAVFHRAAGTPGLAYWKYLMSSDYPTPVSIQWGWSTDTPVPADYDGDGFTDPAIYRPIFPGVNGLWAVLEEGDEEEYYYFGYNTDIPVPRDYNGSGHADVSVVRPGTGNLIWVLNDESIDEYCVVYWGLSTDKLVPADYDGDGKTEVAVFRPSDGTWYILNQDCPATPPPPPPAPPPPPDYQAVSWGLSTDKPVPGDYDGDGEYDVAVFRPSDATWYIRQSSEDYEMLALPWGLSTDIPVPGDYDGDGKFDVAVFRPSNATWYVLKSSDPNPDHMLSVQFGEGTDTPVPALYIP